VIIVGDVCRGFGRKSKVVNPVGVNVASVVENVFVVIAKLEVYELEISHDVF
jgi:hypothetical protein